MVDLEYEKTSRLKVPAELRRRAEPRQVGGCEGFSQSPPPIATVRFLESGIRAGGILSAEEEGTRQRRVTGFPRHRTARYVAAIGSGRICLVVGQARPRHAPAEPGYSRPCPVWPRPPDQSARLALSVGADLSSSPGTNSSLYHAGRRCSVPRAARHRGYPARPLVPCRRASRRGCVTGRPVSSG